MRGWQLATPVAFFIYQRPDTTARVFAEIARARPPRLLVVADGPRLDRPGEEERCAAARTVVDRVDWDCEVLTHFADENLGCRRRISSGLDWVFATVEEAIILEDDCLPHPSFFRFCEQLLKRYRNDTRIAMIGGSNFQPRATRCRYSYYFSRYSHIWGWASWRRAWQEYDGEMRLWPRAREERVLETVLSSPGSVRHWTKVFEAVHGGEIDTWDYQWLFSCWMQNRLSIIPSVNLVSNIGFAEDATHTKSGSPYGNMLTEAIPFPLVHPPYVAQNKQADEFTQRHVFGPPSILVRGVRRISRILRSSRLS